MASTTRAPLRFNQEGNLRLYFGRDAIAFERSPEGPKLRNAETFGKVRPHGVHDKAVLAEDEYIKVSEKYPAPHEPYVEDGVIQYSEHEITAHITAEFRSETRTEPDSDRMLNFGVVGRRLLTIERQPGGRRCVTVIERYFGDAGERCASPVFDVDNKPVLPGVGALVALYPLTSPGRDLLRVSLDADQDSHKRLAKRLRKQLADRENPAGIEADRKRLKSLKERIDASASDRMIALVRNPGSQEREQLIAQAKLAAELMLADAAERWNALCHEPKDERFGRHGRARP